MSTRILSWTTSLAKLHPWQHSHIPDAESPASTRLCYQCQEKLLDSVHQNKSPGNVHRDFNNKDLPITRNSAFHIVLELQEAHQSTGSSTVRPPSVMHRGHYMGTITQQAPSQLHPEGVRPFPRTQEGSSKDPDAGAQLLKIVVSPGQCPQRYAHTPSRSSGPHS